jgi:hypothetical protein
MAFEVSDIFLNIQVPAHFLCYGYLCIIDPDTILNFGPQNGRHLLGQGKSSKRYVYNWGMQLGCQRRWGLSSRTSCRLSTEQASGTSLRRHAMRESHLGLISVV